jgi:integrase/recombinase XerD
MISLFVKNNHDIILLILKLGGNIMVNQNKRFKLCKFKFETDTGGDVERFMITDELLPMFEINQWLEAKSLRKISTGKEYGSKLVVYLNYLNDYGIEYDQASNKHVLDFIKHLIYGDFKELIIKSIETQLSYSTLRSYVTVITEMYKWLDNNYLTNINFSEKKNFHRASKSFLYGQIYSYDYKYIINSYIPHLKGGREYIKWYDKTEKEALCNGFLTLRDESVFRLTLEGFRIDEVLSMQLDHYDAVKKVIQPSRSKGKQDANRKHNHLRTVALPEHTTALLNQYILTERMTAENESGIISQYVFINLIRGKNQGKPLTYRTYWDCIKRCAKRAGIDPQKIRTHSGRSTKVMEFLEHQVLYPQDGITDIILMESFGWRSSSSIEFYRDHNNPIIAQEVMKKLHKKVGDKID